MPETTTVFGAWPNEADWYYCATVDLFGETDYVYGYATGDEPTKAALQDHARCRHSWVAGMMHVHDEDIEEVNAVRPVECEQCEASYAERDRDPLIIIGWETAQIERATENAGPVE